MNANTTERNHFVVYADMLGFGDLVLSHKTAVPETLHRELTPRTMSLSLAFGNPLQRRFRNFHSELHAAINGIEWAEQTAVVVFSDSMFLATAEAGACMTFCERLVCRCVPADVPVRIGVGFGTFVSHTFSFESTAVVKMISTQFLGTGVIYAVQAEKALKGLRIALHPSAASALALDKRRVALPEGAANDSASHEWNYLPTGNDWRGNRGGFDRNGFVRCVEKMRDEVGADPSKRVHYDETLAAIGRMVSQMHNDWTRKPGQRF